MRIHEILTEWETTTSSSWEKSKTNDEFSQSGGGTRIDKSVDNPGRAEYFAKKREREAQAAADTEARRQQFLKSKGLENASGREKRSAMDNARFSGEFTDTEPSYDDLGKDPGSHLEVTKKNVPPVNSRTVTSTASSSPPVTRVTTAPAPMPSAEISSDSAPAAVPQSKVPAASTPARTSTNFSSVGRSLSPQTTTTTRTPPAKGRSADKWLDFTDTDNDPWLRDSDDDDDW